MNVLTSLEWRRLAKTSEFTLIFASSAAGSYFTPSLFNLRTRGIARLIQRILP